MPQHKIWVVMSLLVLVASLVNVLSGSVFISPYEFLKIIFDSEKTKEAYFIIIWNYRLPKMLTAVLVGAGLSVSGLLLQSFFRNPLAGPHVLGISAGAGLGVALLLLAHVQLWTGTIALAGISGSAAVMFFILLVSQKVKNATTLLVIGLMIGFLASAVVSLLQYFSEANELQSFVIWGMGKLGGISGMSLAILAICILSGISLVVMLIKPLDALLLGENYARSLGIDVSKTKVLIILATSLLAGSITGFCGPIAFVGIVVPHLARSIFNNAAHRVLIPATLLTGILLVLLCDAVCQLPGYPTTIPINVITSFLGSPLVIYFLIRPNKFRL